MGRLCPICDSPIEKGAKKCSFCGTDLTIFGGELEGASADEERLVKESFSEMEANAQRSASAPASASATSRVEPAKPSAATKGAEAQFQCPNCNGLVKDSDTVCPHCGAMFVEDETAQFQCPACGTMVEASSTKCQGCGAIFVEDEGEKEKASSGSAIASSAPAPALTPAPTVAKPAEPGAAASQAQAGPEAPVTQDEELTRIISAAKRIRETREDEVAAKAVDKKKAQKGGGFRFFKMGKREDAVTKEVSQPAPNAPSSQAATSAPPQRPKPTAAIEPAPGSTAPAAPATQPTKRQFPTDPREQGKELARLVAEVRGLLGIATERDILIDESKELLDRAITAGRERQFVQALGIISDAEDKLNVRLKDYVAATLLSLQEETRVAQRLGGSISRAEILMKEASRGAETLDYQAALVFIDKLRTELSPVTGKYNDTKEALHRYERLVKDIRAVGVDNEPLKVILETAKNAFDGLDFAKTESIVKKSTDEIIAQIPDRMNAEIEKAKQMLVEAKMKSDVGVTPQITILKSAIKYLREERYLEALAEMKRFKKEMKKLLNPT